MFKRKKPRKNYRKGSKRRQRWAFLRRFVIGFYIVAGIAALLATSCLFILIHDVITQCDYFKAQSLKIEGLQRLSENQIIEHARVHKGMNVLAINLGITRKRLMALPWIAEAEVRRVIPAKLYIRIKEHSPLAIVDLGRKYMINQHGKIFKEWTASDPANLPLIRGLELSDIRAYGKTMTAQRRPPNPAKRAEAAFRRNGTPFEAVMQVLTLGKRTHSILPNRSIRQIRVDREIGITLKAFKQMKTIVLGYHNYPLKYAMLKNLLKYQKQKRNLPDFSRIDLNDVNRIVVNPVRLETPDGEHKEV